VEATRRVHVGADAQTWTDATALDRLEVVHLVRHILTVIQIIDGLTERKTIRVRRNVLKITNRLFRLETPIAYATAEIRRHDTEIKSILGVIASIRSEVDITTGNWPSGWQWFASLGLF
jgi:hypothetical protein